MNTPDLSDDPAGDLVHDAFELFDRVDDVRFVGLAPWDAQRLPGFGPWLEKNRSAVRDAFRAGIAVQAAWCLTEGSDAIPRSHLAVVLVSSFFVAIYGKYLVDGGYYANPKQWRTGNGRGVDVQLETRHAAAH